ncbi:MULTISPECIES: hypothetical protein [unclassified Streptomyces]|uniref:hypothetical protein n=1 Tax=Streptomyces sp. NPDC127129 TaxID=3345373 RepID=UPI003639DD6D
MSSYFGWAVGLAGLLFAIGGVLALTRGWILPYQRRWIRRTAVFGWAQLVVAVAFLLHAAEALLVEDPGVGVAVSNTGFAALLCGLGLAVYAQWPREDAGENG